MTSSDAWLVVGLRNPGPKYADTRHNVGGMVVETLAARVGAPLKANRRRRADVAEARLGDQPGVRTILALPHSYMNESGGPVAGLCAFYKVPPERLVVVHDEIDLPLGSVRVKFGGGDNGHNGLRSVRASLGTGDYLRVRFGVGRPPGRMDPAAYVLKSLSAAERRDVDVEVERVADAVEALVVDGLTYAQNTYNS
ncbi:aminoacyl-tRNA hydrolase [Phytoactinopolyspora halotolerans]|uniref:Peptidyl-tRNA hydrolase n=1 Tax=Phytoactinopolyspora halotolerans TaxID=1981512 RepID=A0A6L9S312_9ACTN|nr:aminoacyl-tRNA hydrolase [Phytoactinopolyspora halotolerans]NED99585.1 aminoacyl-tRNA hydrolase [Phytoactinopolyspora halotolerans]